MVRSRPTKEQDLADAGIDFVVGDFFLDELVGDVVADGEGVKERAFLKDHADAGAQGEELFLGHCGDFFAEELDAALVRAEKSVGQFEENAFADAGGAEQDARFAWATEKEMSLRTGGPSKAMVT